MAEMRGPSGSKALRSFEVPSAFAAVPAAAPVAAGAISRFLHSPFFLYQVVSARRVRCNTYRAWYLASVCRFLLARGLTRSSMPAPVQVPRLPLPPQYTAALCTRVRCSRLASSLVGTSSSSPSAAPAQS